MRIKRYSIDLLKPEWPKWKKSIANFFLFNIPILYIRKVNRILKKRSHLKGGTFIKKVCEDIGIEYELYNGENLPAEGPVTMVANHPGGADVLATIATIWDFRTDFKILANELICVEPVVDLVIPVNVMKKKDKVNLEEIHKAYKKDNIVVFFAAGKNSRYNDQGLLRDRRWRTSFLDYAYQYKTPIVILNIDAGNTPLFYKVSKIRENSSSLKKIPLENMFQLREIFKQKGRKVNLITSDPIPFDIWSQHYVKGDIKKNRLLADKLYDFNYSMTSDKTAIQWGN